MDRDLDGLDPLAPERQGQHLGVVVVVANAGSLERSRGEGAVAGLAVAGHGLHESAEQGTGGAVGERAVPAHPVARAEEAGAEHVVGAPAGDGLEHALEFGGVVLAVAIQVDRGAVALVAGDLEPSSERGAEAARGGVRVHPRTVLPSHPRRGVTRAVVDEEHVDGQTAGAIRNASEHAAHGRLLIAGNDNSKAPRNSLLRKRPA